MDTLPYLVEAVDARLAAALEQRLKLRWRGTEDQRWHPRSVPATRSVAKCSGNSTRTCRLAVGLVGMDRLGEPRDQPIAMLPTIARLIDEGVTGLVMANPISDWRWASTWLPATFIEVR